MKFSILLILVSMFFIACSSVEEDRYLTTELSGLYRYKSVYSTESCNEDLKYDIDLRDILQYPYFMLEGRKADIGGDDEILVYDCEDKRFNACIKEDEYEEAVEVVFAEGGEGNWGILSKVRASYDRVEERCVYERERFTSYKLDSSTDGENVGLGDLLTIDFDYQAYYDADSSVADCKRANIDTSLLECVNKRRYLAQRSLINEVDQEVFNKKNEEIEEE